MLEARNIRFLLPLLISVVAAAPLSAVEVGSSVVVIRSAPLKVGRTTVETLNQGDLVVIKEVQGEWLWVSRVASGWLHRRDVVPFDQALAYFSEMARQAPDRPGWYHLRGGLWHERGEHEKALADYDEALRRDAEYTVSYIHRAILLTELGHFERASADFNQALKLDPTNATIYNNRSALRHKQERYDEAIEDLDAAIRLNPSFALAWQHRGYNRSLTGDHKQAIADYDEAIRLHPNRAAPYKLRADALKIVGQYGPAVADLKKAIELNPKDAIPHNTLAWLLATCPEAPFRNGSQAIKYARLACELTEWNNGICLDTLASAHAESGNFAEAVRWQQKALTFDTPNFDKVNAQIRLQLYQEEKAYRDEVLLTGP